MRPDWPPHRPRFPHRHISEPYVPRQLPGAVVSEASRQSGLSSVSIASDASSYAQHALGFKHCAAPVGPRHTGTWRRWKKRRPPSAMATLSDVTAPRGPPLAEAAQGSSHRAAGTGQLAQGSWHRAAGTGAAPAVALRPAMAVPVALRRALRCALPWPRRHMGQLARRRVAALSV